VDTLSGVGPMRSNIPPKVRAELAAAASEPYLNGTDPHLLRRLEVLERYVRHHDRTIRQMLDILSEWAENASDAYPKTGTDAQ